MCAADTCVVFGDRWRDTWVAGNPTAIIRYVLDNSQHRKQAVRRGWSGGKNVLKRAEQLRDLPIRGE
jgi:hypothetical protein